MLVVLNRRSGAGKAGDRWDRYGKAILKKAGLEREDQQVVERERDVDRSIGNALSQGETLFIAAGGDGTFNRMVSGLMTFDENLRRDAVLGAVGLGSSNDLHKPIDGEKTVERIPFRLDRERSRWSNLVRIITMDGKGNEGVYHSVVNSSMGIIAQGNLIFNRDRGITGIFKRIWTPLGIYSAAIISMIDFEPLKCQIDLDGRRSQTSVTSLSVLLSPHFTGDLVYDTPVDPFMDHFLVNLVEGMDFFERTRAFGGIVRGKFKGRSKCHSWKSRNLVVIPERDAIIEFDGEVETVSRVEFKLIKGGIRICA